MNKILIIIFSFCISTTYAQKKEYVLENIIQYRIKNDFYSDFLNIYSTKDNRTHLLVTQTPMGNFASLKINDNLYIVYSEEKNKTFKIDFEGTKDLLGYAFALSDNPSLTVLNLANSYSTKKENREETILNNKCEVYTIINNDDNEDNKTEICIDTKSDINTVPLLNNEINLKGLVYRFGQNIILERIDLLKNVLKEESENEEEISIEDFTFQFDEKAEIEAYKKQYNKK